MRGSQQRFREVSARIPDEGYAMQKEPLLKRLHLSCSFPLLAIFADGVRDRCRPRHGTRVSEVIEM